METLQALEKLRQICSRQEKCRADVVALLKKWGVEQVHHNEIVNQLISDNYLNEMRYTSAFVRDKIKFDHWGLIKIRYFLKLKGLASEVCDAVFKEIDMDEYKSMVGKEIQKKRKTLKGPSREIWAKLARYGTSRGYEMEVMQDFLDA
jgi:regulatory protein